MMNKLKFLLAMAAVLGAGSAATADSNLSPLHNPINGLDVDGNTRINARDALLVINELLKPNTAGTTATALAETDTTTFFWDTNNDFRVTARDALLVINHLTVVPEPASFVLGGSALAAFAACAWRRRRARA
jgi:Dockerin type I domain